MTINTRREAINEALHTTRNEVGHCQEVTRGWYNAPSVGDVDGDGDADAKDGWLSEPLWARHPGDRNPPGGVPLYFEKDGGRGFGHRCATLLFPGRLRSTDMFGNRYSPGNCSTVTGATTSDAIAVIESAMAVSYVGWSDTIDGNKIPEEVPPPPPEMTRGRRVDDMIHKNRRSLAKAKPGSIRARILQRTLNALLRIPQFPKK